MFSSELVEPEDENLFENLSGILASDLSFVELSEICLR